MIRLTAPTIEDDDLAAVREVLATGFLVQGPRVRAFEKAVAEAVGVHHAVAVSNCTCALHLALLALDVRPGDICVLPAYSWIATANVIELCGACPVFIDILPDTFNIDPNKLEAELKRLTRDHATAKKVKAILPVHTFGQMAEMPSINEIASRWNLKVVEDAACALGASWEGKAAAGSSEIGCLSFHPRKAITTGEGGILTTNNADWTRKLRALRNHGADPEQSTPDFILPGYNYRLTEFQAALGSTQMEKLPRIIKARREAAARYDELLSQTNLQKPSVSADAYHVYQSYVTLLPASKASRRVEIILGARARGVEVQIGTVHMPMTTYYRNRYSYKAGDFPCADDTAIRTLTLPLYEGITPDEQRMVVEVLTNLIERRDV